MFKYIFYVLKRILFNIFLLYSFNIIVSPIGLIIPINFITVGVITILGLPALLALILIFFLIF